MKSKKIIKALELKKNIKGAEITRAAGNAETTKYICFWEEGKLFYAVTFIEDKKTKERELKKLKISQNGELLKVINL